MTAQRPPNNPITEIHSSSTASSSSASSVSSNFPGNHNIHQTDMLLNMLHEETERQIQYAWDAYRRIARRAAFPEMTLQQDTPTTDNESSRPNLPPTENSQNIHTSSLMQSRSNSISTSSSQSQTSFVRGDVDDDLTAATNPSSNNNDNNNLPQEQGQIEQKSVTDRSSSSDLFGAMDV